MSDRSALPTEAGQGRGPAPRSEAPARVAKTPLVVVAAIAAAALAWGVKLHWDRSNLAAEAQRSAEEYEPVVGTVVARRLSAAVPLVLPGTTEPFYVASIYARATGYLAERRVDIGSRVRKGDLLARIAAPDLDQRMRESEATLGQREAELEQAKANANQARANKDLANVTNGRVATLADEGWATKQNADQTRYTLATQDAAVASAQAGVTVAQANYDAQVASVREVKELTGFEEVVAPFDGVVTARSVEVGDLISGTASGGTPMFVLQRDDILRIHVDVPQSAAVGLKDGVMAEVMLPERPTDVFEGVVSRNASSLDVGTRTLPTEIDVKNDAQSLTSGLFVNVRLSVPQQSGHVSVPAAALIFNGEGLRVAVVGDDMRARLRAVSIYRDFGTSVELASGLSGGERIATAVPADLQDGEAVRLATPSRGTAP